MTHQPEYRTRRQAVDYIRAMGLPMSLSTLHRLSADGTGPAFRRFGPYAMYRAADLDAWIEARLIPGDRDE